MDDSPLIVFTPSGKRGRFSAGTTVLDAARRLGVDIDSVCGGRAICGRCQIVVSEGRFDKHGITSRANHISASNEAEQQLDAKGDIKPGRRLSCQAELHRDCVIDVPEDSQVHRQVIRKRADARQIDLDPAIRLHFVEVVPPDMADPRGDFQRLVQALEAQWQLDANALSADLAVLRQLQTVLRQGQWQVTAAVHEGSRVIALWPGYFDDVYAVAIDIGSTTISAHLCDYRSGTVLAASGMMNPQIRFGEDLMSRVSYIMMHPGGDEEQTLAVREALNRLIEEVATVVGADKEQILELSFVGNPIMHHLLLGINPIELGTAPFALATDAAITLPARDLDLAINPGGRCYILPCIAGHVGADTAGVLLSEGPHMSDQVSLVVDIGTNAEIVLGNNERLLACSSPTGPAFEGAQISSGQRAAPGAIERVRIDPETLEPKFQVIGANIWSDHPGFYKATRRMGVTGICGSGIIEVLGEMFLAGILTADGKIDGAAAARSPRIQAHERTYAYLLHDKEPQIWITQNDVRAIQLAKAALYAGARLLMDQLGVDQVDRILLAGAFGSHIDVKYAALLGLIPDCDLEHVQNAGNAAGTGARIALLNQHARAEIADVVRSIEKVETAVEPRFQEHFVEAMAIPHKTAATPHLAKVFTLPTPTATDADTTARPRRRRRRKQPQ